MPPFIVFDAQDFLEEVTKVKKFWMHTKLNKLRIETNHNESTISLYSIHKESGMETAVTIPAYISADCIMTIGTVNPYVTGSSPVARAKLDSRSISAMSRTVFSSKTKPFVHL